MRTPIAALFAATLVATPALALDEFLYCSLTDTRGQKMEYFFAAGPQRGLIETRMGKNGSILTHAQERRPRWSTHVEGGIYVVTYLPDPRFRILMENEGKRIRADILASQAILAREGQMIAKGICGAKDDEESATYSPRPERFW